MVEVNELSKHIPLGRLLHQGLAVNQQVPGTAEALKLMTKPMEVHIWKEMVPGYNWSSRVHNFHCWVQIFTYLVSFPTAISWWLMTMILKNLYKNEMCVGDYAVQLNIKKIPHIPHDTHLSYVCVDLDTRKIPHIMYACLCKHVYICMYMYECRYINTYIYVHIRIYTDGSNRQSIRWKRNLFMCTRDSRYIKYDAQ